MRCSLASVAQFSGLLSYKLKGHGLDSWSGHMPKLWVQSWSGNIQEATHWCFSLTSMFLSLSPSHHLSLESMSMSLGKDKKMRCILCVFLTLSYSFNSATFYFVLALIQPLGKCWSEWHSKEDWSLEITVRGYNQDSSGEVTQWHCHPHPTEKKEKKWTSSSRLTLSFGWSKTWKTYF